jgi:peptide/nickel transport system substrate-binding protein
MCLFLLLTTACAANPPPTPASGSSAPSAPAATPAPQPDRTLVIAIRGEPGTLNGKRGGGLNLIAVRQILNADLTRLDESDGVHLLLAESAPQLNTDSWKVAADGKMETTYKLKPNLTWHDGQPLTAQDFITAWKVYTTTPIGGFDPTPQNLVEDVLAPDPRTVLIKWRQPFPDAAQLDNRFSPLPSHILAQPLQELDSDAFTNLPYWTQEYVGAGPYRLDRWEPGAYLDLRAFDRFALGRPKIDRVRLQIISDPNTAVSNLLADATHIALDNTIRFEQARVLRDQWAGGNRGSVLLSTSDRRFLQVQFRPELASPRAILDRRVRQALAHSIDRQALSDGLLDGQGVLMDTMIFPQERWFPAVDRALTKYPFDTRRAEQLMSEVGYTKGSDGTYASPTDGRFSMELRVSAGGQNEQQNDIIVDGWKRAGYDATSNPFPVARLQDNQFRASFPALQGSVGGAPESLLSAAIGRPENRWNGTNRGAWASPEFDRLFTAFNGSLDPNERTQSIVQALKLVSDEVPVITLYYDFNVTAHVADVQGPRQGGDAWNAHEWQWK